MLLYMLWYIVLLIWDISISLRVSLNFGFVSIKILSCIWSSKNYTYNYLSQLRRDALFCNPSRLRLVFSKIDQWLPNELQSLREFVNHLILV